MLLYILYPKIILFHCVILNNTTHSVMRMILNMNLNDLYDFAL